MMRNDTKKIPITFRVTTEENELLKARAKELGQTVSQYVSERVFQEQGLTATTKRNVYHHLVKIRDHVNLYDRELKSTVDEECDAIWKSLNW